MIPGRGAAVRVPGRRAPVWVSAVRHWPMPYVEYVTTDGVRGTAFVTALVPA